METLVYEGKSNDYTGHDIKSCYNSSDEHDNALKKRFTASNDVTRKQTLISDRQGTDRQQVFRYQDTSYELKSFQKHNLNRGQDCRHNQEGNLQKYNMEFKRFESQHNNRHEFRNQFTTQKTLSSQKNIGLQREVCGRTLNKRSISIIRCPIDVIPLNREDPLVSQAIECYIQALDISYDSNNPARYNLGLILRSCGDIRGAIKQFNKIIRLSSSPWFKGVKSKENRDYLITVTCAYEHAGFCYFKLAKEDGISEEKIKKFSADGEKKLLQAVGLAATLCNLDPEMRNHYQRIWSAFRTLETKYEEENDSPEIIKNYIELLKRTSRFKKIPVVIDTLRRLSKEDLIDIKMLKSALESYLTLHQYEDAFTFLSVSLTNVLPMDCLKELDLLTLKVRLFTAASRRQTGEGSAKLILKPLFDSRIERKVPVSENKREEAFAENDVEIKKLTHGTDDDALDVLIVHDDESGDDVTEKMKKLQRTISYDFGLDVNNIDARRTPGRVKIGQQIEEISRARTVLVLLSEDSQPSHSFTSLLEYIPVIITDCKENGRPEPKVVVGLIHDAVKIPMVLKTYHKIEMSEILEKIEITSQVEEYFDELSEPKASLTDQKQLRPQNKNEISQVKTYSSNSYRAMDDTLSRESAGDFSDCIYSKMSLFCALINQDWRTFVKSQSV